MKQIRIPVRSLEIGEREVEYVAKCVRSGWVSSIGEYVTTFEERFAGVQTNDIKQTCHKI